MNDTLVLDWFDRLPSWKKKEFMRQIRGRYRKALIETRQIKEQNKKELQDRILLPAQNQLCEALHAHPSLSTTWKDTQNVRVNMQYHEDGRHATVRAEFNEKSNSIRIFMSDGLSGTIYKSFRVKIETDPQHILTRTLKEVRLLRANEITES